MGQPIDHGREWFTITDIDTGIEYTFDMTFLLSRYRCTYGDCCTGIEADPNIGCCIEGVSLESVTEYRRLVASAERAKELGVWINGKDEEYAEPESWVIFREPETDGGDVDPEDFEDEYAKTVELHSACIFYNPPNDDGIGVGCALHVAAMIDGVDYYDRKPIPCWQYPLYFAEVLLNDAGQLDKAIIGPVDRSNCGLASGASAWWCIDDDRNYSPDNNIALHNLKETLVRMSSQWVWDRLSEYAAARTLSDSSKGYGSPITASGPGDGYSATRPMTLVEAVNVKISKKSEKRKKVDH